MPNNKKILVAVDGTAASRRTVAYVADMVCGNSGCRVGLLHVELPPHMIEWGGTEDAKTENKVSLERAKAYAAMENAARAAGEVELQKLQPLFAEKKIEVDGLYIQFDEPLVAKNITERILKTAQEGDYGTVVVGQHSFSGLKRFFGHHVGEDLLRSADGLAVWVVA